MKAPRVGLVGFYGRGNFGDDLMGVLFGQFLREIGIPFCVHQFDGACARRFGFEVVNSQEDFLDQIDVMLWGGGGLLVPWKSAIQRLLFADAASHFERLVEGARRRGIRMMAASVGGSGAVHEPLTPRYKQQFVEAAECITVRNPQDVAFLERHGIPGGFFSDIVWLTSEAFPVRPRAGERMRIGVDIYPSNLLRHHALHLIALLYAITRKHRDCEFVLMDSTNRTAKPYRGMGLVVRGPNVERYQFENLEEDIGMLASLDLILSTRLHVPMVCLQYQVPVISLFSEGKTKLAFQQVGLAHSLFSHARLGEFLSLMLRREKLEAFRKTFPFPDLERLRVHSTNHLATLQNRLLGNLQN